MTLIAKQASLAQPPVPPTAPTRQPFSPNRSESRRRRIPSWIAFLVLAAVAIGTGAVVWAKTPKSQRTDLLYHKLRREPLQLTVVERGALESADNRDVICRVRAGTKASSLTIKWVVEDGTLVKQGQLLVEIDDSALQDQLKAQKITLDTARANRTQSEENYKIVVSQCDSDVASARVGVELAKIDLKKYEEGDYLQAKKEIDGKIKLAESDCELQRERVAYTERMVKLKYLSPAQLQAENSKLQGYNVQLEKAKEELRVLQDFTRNRTVKDLTNKLEEAKRALERQLTQARAKTIQVESERKTKTSIYEQEEDKYRDIEEQITNCRLYSPQDGLVVYYISEQSRWGSGSSQSIVAVGEPVKEGQRLMRIPDLRRMVVNTKVHEAMISRVHGEQWKQTGFSDALRATFMLDPHPMSRLVAQHSVPDLKERLHDYDYKKVEDGQKASVRIDAFPDRLLPGHVKSVATVASQQDWMSADVKVYQTLVSIDESMDGLKPGMSAEVTVQVDGAAEEVLALPLQAIVGGAEMGAKRKCWVKTATGPVEREIVVGLWNEKMAEVRSGLNEGDEVIVNPKVLLGDRARVRTGSDSEQPDAANTNYGEMKGKSKGRGPMGKGGMNGGKMPIAK